MDVFENPFYVLKATPRDRKSKVFELADDLALHGDQDAAAQARNLLTNPRNRLTAEIAWFPGLSPRRVEIYLKEIRDGAVPDSFDGLNAICQANLVATTLPHRAKGGTEALREGIEQLANVVDSLDPEEVMRAVNEDRLASGVPPLTDVSQVENEIASRCRHYQRQITTVLDELPTELMVSTYERLIADSSLGGEEEAHRLINDVVDAYELHATGFLADEAIRIGKMIDATRSAADEKMPEIHVRKSVRAIVDSLSAWDRVAQPIQLSRKSRGLDHDESNLLAHRARSLAVHLFNEHDYLDDAKLLSTTLQRLFVEVAVVSETVDDDVRALNEIEATRRNNASSAEKEQAEFAAEITYETTFGLIFKDTFRISPAGIEYKGVLTPLDDISGVSWGAVRHSTNGIPTGTTYHFKYGSPRGVTEIQPRDQHQHQEIVSKVWRAVCIRILVNMMETWGKGGSVNIGGVQVRDDGIVLTRTRIFKSDEQKFHTWGEMSKGGYDGNLAFYGKPDKKFTAVFSYKDTFNVHIFDFAIDRIWEGKASKLSQIFGSQ